MRKECTIVKDFEDIMAELKIVLEGLRTDLVGEELMLH